MPLVLDVRDVVRCAGFAVADVHCSHEPGDWSASESAPRDALVLARRGTFRRRVEGRWQVLEPNVAYFQRAGDEQQFAHPHGGGDRCLSIAVPSGLATDELPADAFATPASIDLGARAVVTGARGGQRADDLEETLVLLVTEALSAARNGARPHRVLPSRHRLAGSGREALAVDPGLGLIALAGRLGCSPDHLSRAFAQSAGATFTAYRRRLRIRAALERIGDGHTDLARVAVDTGFADHAHMTRSIRSEVGATPTRVRQLLSEGQPMDVSAERLDEQDVR